MRESVRAEAKDMAMPWARRRWAAVEHMTVRGWSASGGAKCRPVAGRMATRRDVGQAPAATDVAGSIDRPVRALGSRSALFVTRVAGHEPVSTGLASQVVVRPQADVPTGLSASPIGTARPPVLARRAEPIVSFLTDSAREDPASVPMRRLPVPPARAFSAPIAHPSLPVRLRLNALSRWRAWQQFATWRRPGGFDWLGWRTRIEPTLLASFALIASAAVLIGLYSFSSGGLYNPPTPSPSQTHGPPPDSPAVTVAPDVRAIHPAPGVHRTPGRDRPSLPQAYASWPAPSDPAVGSTLAATRAAQSGARVPTVRRTTAPAGGGGSVPAPSPTPSDTPTPSPSPTDTAPATTDPPTPSPTDTATATAGP